MRGGWPGEPPRPKYADPLDCDWTALVVGDRFHMPYDHRHHTLDDLHSPARRGTVTAITEGGEFFAAKTDEGQEGVPFYAPHVRRGTRPAKEFEQCRDREQTDRMVQAMGGYDLLTYDDLAVFNATWERRRQAYLRRLAGF